MAKKSQLDEAIANLYARKDALLTQVEWVAGEIEQLVLIKKAKPKLAAKSSRKAKSGDSEAATS